MKRNKFVLIFAVVLVMLCITLCATACVHKSYTAKFIFVNIDSDSNTVITLKASAGDEITPPEPQTIAGKRFKGWYLDEDGTDGPVTPLTVMPKKNLTYYGIYEDIDPTIQIPDDYNMAFENEDNNGTIYLAGEDVYLQINDRVLLSTLSRDGDTAEFTLDDKDYCAFLDYDEATFGLYEYAFDKDAYVLYLPTSNTFNFERCLYFENNNENFRLMGYAYDTLWASGDCEEIVSAFEEFNLTVTEDNTYKNFEDCRIKLTKRVRQSEDTGEKPVVYSAFMIYDESLYGNFTHYENQKIRLSLDGYGFGTYTDENGKVSKGVCELAEVDVYKDTFVNFTNTATGDVSLLLIASQNTFAPIGNEIGIYRVFDVLDQVAGSYYLLINGWGSVEVYYGADVAYNPETQVATGTYTINENDEFIYTVSEIVREDLLTDIYKTTFKFKLTTYGSGLYVTKAYAVYSNALAGNYANASGTEKLILDGYGNAVHVKNGENFDGAVQIDGDLIMITTASDEQRIFRVQEDTFRQIGNEYGYYISYSYLNGMTSSLSIFFNGEGKATEYDISNPEAPIALRNGTYLKTDNEGEYIVTFGSENIRLALRQMNFGSLQEPVWYSVYLVHNPEWDITLRNTDLNETLVLDGYGLNAVYTTSTGTVWNGEFVWEWKLITMLAIGVEDYNVMTFKVTNQTFELRNDEAGVYYTYVKEAAVSTDNVRMLLDGDGEALYSVYDSANDTYNNTSGTYTVNGETEEYTFTSTEQAPIKFILAERNFVTVFIVYDENWAGEYVNDYEYEFVLDGYGNAWYRDEDSKGICQVFGENYDGVTCTINGENFAMLLDKAKGTFKRTMDPLGYYYLFDYDTVRGRTRLCINADNTATLEEYDDEQANYITIARSTLTEGIGENVFVFSSADNNFTFKLDLIGGYDVYRVQDEYATTLTCSKSITLKNEEPLRLVLNGFGDAKYTFYDPEQDRERTFEGYYRIDGNSLTFIAIGTNGATYYTYEMEIDFQKGTFEIISRD